VPRTFSNYPDFRDEDSTSKSKLRNVLVAYSHIDKEIGYAQGN